MVGWRHPRVARQEPGRHNAWPKTEADGAEIGRAPEGPIASEVGFPSREESPGGLS